MCSHRFRTRDGKTVDAQWKHCESTVKASGNLKQKARLRKEPIRSRCRRGSGEREPGQVSANTYGQYFDLDLGAGFCLLGFRGTAARALMTRLEGFLTRRF